jgi:hypothetical protein
MRIRLPLIKFERGYGYDDGVVFIESSQVKFAKHVGVYNPGDFSGLKNYSEITLADGSKYTIKLGIHELLNKVG